MPRIQGGAGRPAEAATGVAGLGALVAYVFGVRDPEAITAMLAAVAVLPALVTWLVTVGGIRGALRMVWRGRG